MYKVQCTSAAGCVGEDSIEVKVTKGYMDDIVPNAFTPNGDGKNDFFGVQTWGISELNFIVYNRWGEVVFQTSDPTRRWDGKYKGEPAASGAFVYQISANTPCGRIFRKGTVVLIR
jgi:gliding motility-associated-like protein